MARIPDEVIERLKERVAVQRLAEARGVLLKAHGADLIGRCPFHEDKTPSLVITPAKNLWHCLGACQQGGTVIDWVMKAEGVSFRHAVELLQEDDLPLAAASGSMPTQHSTVRKLPTTFTQEADERQLLSQVIEYYHQSLLKNADALNYLSLRGLNAAEAVRTFKLGFSDRTLGYRLPLGNRMEGAALRGQLQRLGVLRSSGHEHFRGSLVIPVISPTGEVTEIYGRKITDKVKPGTPLHLYLPGPHRGVWNAAALGTTPEVILCEALIDALTFWCAGYRNVTASYGVQGFTEDHLAAFKQHGIQRVLIAYDRDEAGDHATEKLAKQLMAEGLDCYRISFPKGMDANEYALKVGPPAKSLGVAIRAAQWLGQGKAQAITTVALEPACVDSVLPPAVAVQEKTLSAASVRTTTSSSLVAEEAAKGNVTPAGTPMVQPLAVALAADAEPRPETERLPAAVAAPSEPSPALPAQVIPPAPTPPTQPHTKALGHEREYALTLSERRYRVRGLEKNSSYETLKVNLLASRAAIDGVGESVHVDTFDLYQARARATFIHQAAVELGVNEEIVKADLGKLLLMLEAEQEKLLTAAQQPPAPAAVQILEAEREAALGLLRDPQLIERIAGDFSRCGVVGERTNALISYLATISRKLKRPLALLIQSTSAAGKSSLLDAVLKLVPEEDRIVYSAMTGQSLYYMGEMNLKHKLLAIAEEEGMARASYALKLLQSEGELTIASTSKDATTGKLTTETYHVEGPVMIALTTTAASIDEELLNRCLVLTIDEGREQTQAIHAAQRRRRTLAGLQAQVEREEILQLHQNAQRLLQPLAVVNPYAHRLTFLDDRTRTRRDHEKYLTLIDTIALLHQHQRETKHLAHGKRTVRFIEVTLQDIALANTLAHEVLGRTLDELPPQTRRLLGLVVGLVEAHCHTQHISRAQYRFSRRQVGEATKWGDTQLKIHLGRLVELEYLLVHRGGRGQSFEYELLFDGRSADGGPHVNGLLDVDALNREYGAAQSGDPVLRSGSGRGPVGPRSEGGRRVVRAIQPMQIPCRKGS